MNTNKRPQVVLVHRSFVINDEGLILAIQRSAQDRNNAGKWEAPGGKLDEGQELDGVLEREGMEETGLLLRPVDTLAHCESKVISEGDSQYAGLPYVVLFGISRVAGGTLQLSSEHDDARWCAYFEFVKLPLTIETRRAATVLESRLRNFGAL